MIENWPRIKKFSLRMEGGYVSAEEAARRGDLGGETKYGITKRDFPEEDIAALTEQRAEQLYQEIYFNAHGTQRACCDLLPWPLDLVHFDAVINVGNAHREKGQWIWTGNANKILQRGFNVKDDGFIGRITLAAANVVVAEDVQRVIEQRRAYYRQLALDAPRLALNLHGWLNRCDLVEKEIR
jgi:lysozyme family protein